MGDDFQPAAGLFGVAARLMRQALQHPLTTAHHARQLSRQLAAVLTGDSTLAPSRDDRRFSDPTWRTHPLYRRAMQGYLATTAQAQAWLADAGLAPKQHAQAQFLLNLLGDALAPSNSPANPAALKRLLETGGRSAVEGFKQWCDDLLYNGGLPRQVDTEAFSVGGNLATSTGAVVFRHPLLEVIQYQPPGAMTYSRPLLIVPPQINKFYVLDLSPEKSLVQFCLQQQAQVFMVSWRNPDQAQRDMGLEAYLQALDAAIDATLAITACADLNLFGACSGGITCSLLLGHYAARRKEVVHSLSLVVSVLDTPMDSPIGLLIDEQTLDAAAARSARMGVLDGQELAQAFAWLRANDLIWPYWINNYLMGLPPPAFDILFWNRDTTRLPAALHADLIRLIKDNPLPTPGALELWGTPIDLSQVTVDVFCVAGSNDHITPWTGCYRSARLFGGACEFVLANSGHIQSIINPPGNPKAHYATHSELPSDPAQWQRQSQSHSGSWWLHWQGWLGARSGSLQPAATTLGSANYQPADPAPGRHVHQH